MSFDVYENKLASSGPNIKPRALLLPVIVNKIVILACERGETEQAGDIVPYAADGEFSS